jgi:hypothetical protein
MTEEEEAGYFYANRKEFERNAKAKVPVSLERVVSTRFSHRQSMVTMHGPCATVGCGSEGWGFESLRLRPAQRLLAIARVANRLLTATVLPPSPPLRLLVLALSCLRLRSGGRPTKYLTRLVSSAIRPVTVPMGQTHPEFSAPASDSLVA